MKKIFNLQLGFSVLAIFISLLLVCSDKAQADTLALSGKKTVKVSTASELLEALKSNTCIVVAPGFYDLTYKNSSKVTNKALRDSEGGYIIKDLHNLTIEALDPKLPTQIVVTESYADVLTFDKCSNITIKGLIFGHALKQGYCIGGCLSFNDTNNITLENVELYGCGTYGIESENCTNLKADKCWIHDCTYGIIYMQNSTKFTFTDSFFTFCRQFTLLDLQRSDVVFNNCYFSANFGNFFGKDKTNSITFNKCRFSQSEQTFLDNNAANCSNVKVINTRSPIK